MSLRDTLLQLGYVLIAGGAVFATWALLTGPLGHVLRTGATPEPADDPRNGSNEAQT